MSRELEIWRFAARKLKRNESVMLLVVVESAGSSPGRQGFKMIVAVDDLRGSIGGGVMEVNLVEQAKFQLSHAAIENNSAISEQIHRKNSAQSSGMICSGRQTVIFYRLDSKDLPIVRKIVRALEIHRTKILRITNSEFQIAENQAADFAFRFERRSEKSFSFEEKLGLKNKLSIVGGGHCALALSELMSKMDFHITIFDDRPNLNTLAENKFAHRRQIVESYGQIGDFIQSGASHYVVVMTLGFAGDEIVVRQLLGQNFKYFGVLGSRAKMRTLFRNLTKDGFDAEKLNQIRAPIGLRIKSRTTEEIAVSIAAEIILVKNS